MVLLAMLAAGCQTYAEIALASTPATPLGEEEPTRDANEFEQESAAAVTPDFLRPGPLGVTNHRLDGNRVVEGYADLSLVAPVDVDLNGVPAWIAAVPTRAGVVWAVALDDGRTQAFHVGDGAVRPVPTEPAVLPAGMPPLVRWTDGVARFVTPSGSFSSVINAVPVGDGLAYVDTEGNLVIEGGQLGAAVGRSDSVLRIWQPD